MIQTYKTAAYYSLTKILCNFIIILLEQQEKENEFPIGLNEKIQQKDREIKYVKSVFKNRTFIWKISDGNIGK